jgi:hypothetical protein
MTTPQEAMRAAGNLAVKRGIAGEGSEPPIKRKAPILLPSYPDLPPQKRQRPATEAAAPTARGKETKKSPKKSPKKPPPPASGARPLAPASGARPLAPASGARSLAPASGARPLAPLYEVREMLREWDNARVLVARVGAGQEWTDLKNAWSAMYSLLWPAVKIE